MQDVFLGLVITSSKSHSKLRNYHTHNYVKQHNASFEFGNISCLFIAVCFKCSLIRLQTVIPGILTKSDVRLGFKPCYGFDGLFVFILLAKAVHVTSVNNAFAYLG